jgi:urease accessory protein
MTTAMRTPTEADASEVAGVLFAWFSPAFPTGAFAWSHGLESADLSTETDLGDWLQDVLAHGGGWADAVLMNLARRTGEMGDAAGFARVASLALSLCPSRERQAETVGQGEAFAAAVREGWPQFAPPAAGRLPYSAAAGWSAAMLGAPAPLALAAYLTGFAANLIATGVRMSLCGQSGGVRILARLAPLVADLARRAAVSGEDHLGGCALAADIASMRHETLDGRLFLS